MLPVAIAIIKAWSCKSFIPIKKIKRPDIDPKNLIKTLLKEDFEVWLAKKKKKKINVIDMLNIARREGKKAGLGVSFLPTKVDWVRSQKKLLIGLNE